MPKDMRGVMQEFKSGQLHSGSSTGKVVKNRKQAIAIGLSEQRQMGKPVKPAPKTDADGDYDQGATSPRAPSPKRESVPGMMAARQRLGMDRADSIRHIKKGR